MHARGLISGITRGTNRAHIARAVLESIAHQSQDVLALMQEEAGFSIPALRVDGGASVSDLLMQMQADISQIPVDRPAMTETTAFGAAALAGYGLGLWPSLDVIAGLRQHGHLFTPGETSNRRNEQRVRWQRAVAAARLIGGGEDA
jgi:glycerol kinase